MQDLGTTFLGSGSDVTTLTAGHYQKEIVEDGSGMLQQLFETVHIQPESQQVHIVEGRTRVMIKEMIKQKEIDILVMGTIGRTGIPGLLIGNTAEDIVNDIQCSLMAVKPDGFVSPVSI